MNLSLGGLGGLKRGEVELQVYRGESVQRTPSLIPYLKIRVPKTKDEVRIERRDLSIEHPPQDGHPFLLSPDREDVPESNDSAPHKFSIELIEALIFDCIKPIDSPGFRINPRIGPKTDYCESNDRGRDARYETAPTDRRSHDDAPVIFAAPREAIVGRRFRRFVVCLARSRMMTPTHERVSAMEASRSLPQSWTPQSDFVRSEDINPLPRLANRDCRFTRWRTTTTSANTVLGSVQLDASPRSLSIAKYGV